MSKSKPTSRRRSPAARFLAAFAAMLVMATGLTLIETSVQPEQAQARPFSMPSGPGSLYQDRGCQTSRIPSVRVDSEGNEYTVYNTRYVCEWVEKETRTGMGYWTTRPEFMDFKHIPDAVRDNPTFADPLAQDMFYSWHTAGDGEADPSTVSNLHWYTYQPCKYKSLNGDALLQIKDGLYFDTVDWAKQVNYRLDVYTRWIAAYDVDGETGAQTVVTSPVSEIMRKQKGQNPYTYIRWTGCQSAGLGSEVGVVVQCPVYAKPIVIDGPYGRGLPSLSTISAFAEQTKRRTIREDRERPTPFGSRDWAGLQDPKTHSGGAPGAIAKVKACRDATQVAPLGITLPSPGNYDFDVTMWYVNCSYSIFPGYSNGTFFGGCDKVATTSRLLEYTAHARCDGKLQQGLAAKSVNFDPADCYEAQCEWSAASKNDIVLDNPPDSPADSTPLDAPIIGPDNARIIANGAPVMWMLNLNKMDVDAQDGMAKPTPVANSRYSVFDVDEKSTPWNPILEVEEANVNDPKQYFGSESEGTRGVLSMVPSLVDPKNGEKRTPNWTSLRFFAFSSSLREKPMAITISRMQSWKLPTRVAVVNGVGEFGAVGGSNDVDVIQQVMRCSSTKATVLYMGTRLTPSVPGRTDNSN